MAERAAPPAPYYENSSGQNEFMAMGTNCRFTSAEIFPRVLGGGGGAISKHCEINRAKEKMKRRKFSEASITN